MEPSKAQKGAFQRYIRGFTAYTGPQCGFYLSFTVINPLMLEASKNGKLVGNSVNKERFLPIEE